MWSSEVGYPSEGGPTNTLVPGPVPVGWRTIDYSWSFTKRTTARRSADMSRCHQSMYYGPRGREGSYHTQKGRGHRGIRL